MDSYNLHILEELHQYVAAIHDHKHYTYKFHDSQIPLNQEYTISIYQYRKKRYSYIVLMY